MRLATALGLVLCLPEAPAQSGAPGDEALHPLLEQFAAEADRLVEDVETDLGWSFLAAAFDLPAPAARTLHRDAGGTTYAARLEDLPAELRAGATPVELPADRYYLTKYGSPLAYVRALEVVGGTGLESLEGRRVLDIGYGGIGALRMLALLDAHVVGLDVDPFLAALYGQPGDQGPVPTVDGPVGDVRLVHGAWPGDAGVRAAVGDGYDLVISKNTLKRGYIHPSREAPARLLIDLGVDDATYLAALADAVVPGGLVLLYNLCPPEAGPDEPYVPWADGRSPFSRAEWEAAGFELLAFDVEDDAAARAMAARLEWGTPEELETSLEAWYTLARRRDDEPPASGEGG